MPFCTKCGSEIPQEAFYCPVCGASVKGETSTLIPTQPKLASTSLFDRMIRAAKLDASLYEEVEADAFATTQAFIVVILSSICSGIGTAISQALTGKGPLGIGTGLIGGVFSAFIVWLAWSLITYYVGTSIFGGTASVGELLRTLGFSNSPGVLLFFSFIPVLGGLVSFAVWVWGLIATVVAVRQALDFSTGKAIFTCIIGWIVAIILLVIIGVVFAIPFFLLGL
ncbi:MAG: YIP1 family protein [Candidatus Hodarchaeota archaeon]